VRVAWICPNADDAMLFTGWPRFGWLNRLNASARNCSAARSLMVVLIVSSRPGNSEPLLLLPGTVGQASWPVHAQWHKAPPCASERSSDFPFPSPILPVNAPRFLPR
jgi:hypothetical protein